MILQKDIDKIEKLNLRTQFTRISLLDKQEKVLQEIQGVITSGSIKVTGRSSIRRSLNFTMDINQSDEDLINIFNKIKVEIGYKIQGEIIWIPLGIYIILNKSRQISLNKTTISIQAQDKSAQLDGHVGGVFPISGYLDREKEGGPPTPIDEVIYEIVTNFGEEQPYNILIKDIPQGRKLIRYVGDNTIYFDQNYTTFTTEEIEPYIEEYNYGDDIGYMDTPLVYTNEKGFAIKAGETVKNALDKIVKYLGNFEYFYDAEGHFIFQKIKAYEENDPSTFFSPSDHLKEEEYIFDGDKDILSIKLNPTLSNLKNDFVLWGKRKTIGSAASILYHVAIDDIPELNLVNKYLYKSIDEKGKISYSLFDKEKTTLEKGTEKIGDPCKEWREELYRRALLAKNDGSQYSYYDRELLALWPQVFNSLTGEYSKDPIYWLDFITTDSKLNNYSINKIGRRTYVVNEDRVDRIFAGKNIPNITFFYGATTSSSENKDFQIPPYYQKDFVVSTSGITALEKMQEMIYQKLTFNTSIQLQALPKYYLEPNKKVVISNSIVNDQINGNFIITDFTLPLTQSGSSQITLAETILKL